MTASLGTIGRKAEGKNRTEGGLRAAAWGLHVAVSVLAVFSLLCNGFQWWIDLRMLGVVGTALVKIFWVGTVLVVPWSAGPRLAGWRRPVWVNSGWSAEWARRLLWPTYFVLACLVANTVYFYRLVMLDRIDTGYPVPMPLLAAILLAAWALVTRQWVRGEDRRPDMSAARRRTQVWAAAYGILVGAVASCFFLLQSYAVPLRGPVDVAVVLGNRVMPDGTASVLLRDRTLAAVRLYKAGLARHLFLSGAVWPAKAPDGPALDEPLAMQRVCLENGVPDQAITLDPVGDNTRATALDASRFMQAHGFTTVVVCTDQFHLFRSARCFRELGIPACTAASQPAEWRCADVFATLRELVANCVYTIRPGYHKPRIIGMKLRDAHVVVRKAAGILEIYDGAALVKKYACITGGNAGDKSVEGDRRTPIGMFHVVFKNPDSKFHLSLGLDYPRVEDAQRGLQSGLITQEQYDGIVAALKSDLSLKENQDKLWYTPLGGEIFIHGNAEGRTGTAGCVAVSNPDIEEIYGAIDVGTPVEIQP